MIDCKKWSIWWTYPLLTVKHDEVDNVTDHAVGLFIGARRIGRLEFIGFLGVDHVEARRELETQIEEVEREQAAEQG